MVDQLYSLSLIERLSPEVVVQIGQHLTVQDLVACCATSSRMRYLFDSDLLWRTHCDQDLADSLRTTPCKVTPGFVSPEAEDSSLSPVSEWRLSYMRQQHLWHNWCSGRFQAVEIQQDSDGRGLKFLTDYCVVVLFRHRLEFIDLKPYGAGDKVQLIIKEAEKPFEPIYFSTEFGFLKKVTYLKETLVVIMQFVTQVYHINFSDRKWSLKHTLYLSDPSSKTEFAGCSLFVRNYFMGVCGEPDNTTIHIWDVNTGVKLKEQECPVKNLYSQFFLLLENTNSLNVSVDILAFLSCDFYQSFHLVYNLAQMDYYPFRAMHVKTFQDFSMIIDDFICVRDCDFEISIYNYKTSENILKDPGPCCGCFKLFGHYFLLLLRKDLYLFDTHSRTLLPLELKCIDYVYLLYSDLIIVKKGNYVEIWTIDSITLKMKKVNLPSNYCFNGGIVNNVKTIYILKNTLLYFW